MTYRRRIALALLLSLTACSPAFLTDTSARDRDSTIACDDFERAGVVECVDGETGQWWPCWAADYPCEEEG
jgi:hypothetical protein